MQLYLSEFENYLTYEKRYSKHTLTAYLSDFEQFQNHILKLGLDSILDVESKVIRAWITHLMNDGVSPRSIRRKISVLNTFFKFLKRTHIINHNPVQKAPLPKFQKKLPLYVKETGMDYLLDLQEVNNLSWHEKRDLLIIELFYQTGIRLAELINLEEQSIDFQRKQIKVLGKRNKERLIPFSSKLELSIRHYLEMKKIFWGEQNNTSLFVTNKGNKLYSKFVYRTVNSYLTKISTIKKKSPHILRHTFATHMLNNGADINAIKEILGHSSLSATEIYTHNTIEKLKLIHQQSHPKG